MSCGENFSWLFKDFKVNKSLYNPTLFNGTKSIENDI